MSTHVSYLLVPYGSFLKSQVNQAKVHRRITENLLTCSKLQKIKVSHPHATLTNKLDEVCKIFHQFVGCKFPGLVRNRGSQVKNRRITSSFVNRDFTTFINSSWFRTKSTGVVISSTVDKSLSYVRLASVCQLQSPQTK